MSSFAVIIDTKSEESPNPEFRQFLQRVAHYKSLEVPADYASGYSCLGAKLDSPSSLHKGITLDPETGSWLIAAGTVIDTHDVAPDGNLRLLLKDYLAQGSSVFGRCDGLFALVIYNGLTRSLAVVSDPFGYFSLFYGKRAGRVFVSTSALAVAQQIQAQPSELGIHCFLHTGRIFGNMTVWEDVKRISPATVLEIGGGAIREEIYWRPMVDEAVTKLSFDEVLESSIQLLKHVLKRNLGREGKVWADLTGGFDTRFVTMLLEQTGIPFKADFVGPPHHPDVKVSQKIVDTMGWEYQNFQLPQTWPQECPHYFEEALGRGDGHLNIFLLTRPLWAHQQEQHQLPVLLNGLGGETWRSPLWWPERDNLGQSSEVHYDRQLWSLMHPVPTALFAGDAASQVKAELIEQFRRVGERCPGALNTVKLDYLWAYRETSHVGAWSSVGAGLLRIMPILFSKDIVPHVISLNYRWRAKNLLIRHMLERYNPTLANIEMDHGGPAIPRRMTNIHRFIPYSIHFYRSAANKLSEITLGKSLWRNRHDEGYSRPAWRQEVLKFAEGRRLLQPADMCSGKLYQTGALETCLAQAKSEKFQQDEFLGRIMTVEMALRAVGAAIN